jgi:group I intron endonuclease
MLIYKATNKTNGKAYIGQTTTSLASRTASHVREARYGRRSKSAFHNALLKYGLDNFEIGAIETCDTIDQLNERERHWIASLNTISPNGYNIEPGGNHFPMSEASKAKLRGRKVSEETRQKISQIARNRSPAWNRKIAEANQGRRPSEKQLQGLALGHHRPKTPIERERFRGQTNPRAILTDDEVREIRRLYASNTGKDRWSRKEYSQDRLAEMFNVKQVTISTIVTRRAWQHID